MSKETVSIALMIVLEVKLSDILDAYVHEHVTEKVWTTLDPKFGKDARKIALIVRTLYCLKLAGVAFRSHIARYMEFMGYESCRTDLDLWLKPETRPEDGVQYYSYLLFCRWHFLYATQCRFCATVAMYVLPS